MVPAHGEVRRFIGTSHLRAGRPTAGSGVVLLVCGPVLHVDGVTTTTRLSAAPRDLRARQGALGRVLAKVGVLPPLGELLGVRRRRLLNVGRGVRPWRGLRLDGRGLSPTGAKNEKHGERGRAELHEGSVTRPRGLVDPTSAGAGSSSASFGAQGVAGSLGVELLPADLPSSPKALRCTSWRSKNSAITR